MTNDNYTKVQIPDKLAKLLASQKRFKVAWGGRSGAKSWAFALYCLIRGTREPLTVVGMRETMNSIAESSHSLLVGWIDRVPALKAFYTVQQREIIGRNGTRIIFKGLLERGVHNVKSLEGVDICWVDEAHGVSQKSWDVLIPTIRKPGSEFLISFNRFLEDDPVWTEFCTGKRDNRTAIVHVNYTDNPFCPQEVTDEAIALQASDPELYKHVWLGEPYEQASGRLIPTQMVQDAYDRTGYMNEGYTRIAGLDVARYGADASCIIWRQGDVIGGEQTYKGLSGPNLLASVVDWVVEHKPEVLVVDGTGLGGFWTDFADDSRLGNITTIVEFTGSGKTSTLKGCYNARAESWLLCKKHIEDGLSLKGTSIDLRKELSIQEYKYHTNQKLILQSKQEMRTKGISSPDRADSLTMTYYPAADNAAATLEPGDTYGGYLG